MLSGEWKKAAQADLWSIVDYISDDNPDAAQALKDDLVAKVEKMSNNPKMYRSGRVPGTREMVVAICMRCSPKTGQV